LLHFSQTVDVSLPPIFEDKEEEEYSLSNEEDVDLDAWFEDDEENNELNSCFVPKNGSSSRVTMKLRIGAGFLVATQLEARIAVKVAFMGNGQGLLVYFLADLGCDEQ
jgi:hypothetical protein